MEKVYFRDCSNQQSDHDRKGLTKKHNESKILLYIYIGSLLEPSQVEPETIHKIKF